MLFSIFVHNKDGPFFKRLRRDVARVLKLNNLANYTTYYYQISSNCKKNISKIFQNVIVSDDFFRQKIK